MTATASVVPVRATKQTVSDRPDKNGGLTIDGPGR
jgi:hypothetical protein